MIIPRKYEWLGILYEQDPEVKDLVDKAFDLAKITSEYKKRLLEYNHCNLPAFLNMGCGIPGDSYSFIMQGLEVLDKTKPYENGLSFSDVTNIEYETSRKGTAIQMRFVSEPADCPYRIVGFAAVENRNGSIRKNKGWEMAAPFIIG